MLYGLDDISCQVHGVVARWIFQYLYSGSCVIRLSHVHVLPEAHAVYWPRIDVSISSSALSNDISTSSGMIPQLQTNLDQYPIYAFYSYTTRVTIISEVSGLS